MFGTKNITLKRTKSFSPRGSQSRDVTTGTEAYAFNVL